MRNRLLLILVFCAVAGGLLGCSSSPTKESLITDAGPNPAFLADIPAETPYAFAALEPIPGALFIEHFKDWSGLLDASIQVVEDAIAADDPNDPSGKLVLAFMKEFKGKYSREGFESLGLSLSPRAAIYGIGVLPVVRFDLHDGQKFTEMVQRLEAAAGSAAVMQKVGEVEIRTYTVEEDSTALLRINGNEAVMGFMTAETSALYLPHFAGTAKPKNSMASSRKLEELVEKHKFQKFGVGFLDIEAIATMLLEPSNDLNGQIAAALDMVVRDLDNPACIAEYKSIAARFPRFVGGYDELTVDRMVARGGLIMGDGLGSELMGIKSSIPAYGQSYAQGAPVSFGIGIDFQKLLAMVQKHAGKVRDNPYVCDDLYVLNENASQAAAGATLLPPVLLQLKGLSGVLKSVQWVEPADAVTPQPPDGSLEGQPPVDAGPSAKFDGMMVISTQDAVTLFDSVKLYVPELAQIVLPADGKIHGLGSIASLEPAGPFYGAMSKTQIALGAGDTSQDALLPALQPTTAATPMAQVRYDYGAILDILPDPGYDPQAESLEKLMKSYGPIEMTLDPTEDGLFTTVSYDLKHK